MIIFHLQVGNKDFVPTGDDLKKAVLEFQKEIPVFTYPIKITELRFDPMLTARLILHITDKDWTPSETEQTALRQQFEHVMKDRAGGVVATRHGVKAVLGTTFFEPKL